MSSSKTFVYYHRSCFDGSMAAAVFQHYLDSQPELQSEDFEFISWEYGESVGELSRFEGADVILLDLTFDIEDLGQVAEIARSVLVIDHHPRAHEQAVLRQLFASVEFIIDDERQRKSGAQLTWEHYFEHLPQPDVVRWIGKGDLWIFDEPEIRPLRSAVGSIGFQPNQWNTLFLGDDGPENVNAYIEKGQIMAEVISGQIDYLVKHCQSQVSIDGYTVVACNAPKFLASELGQRLYELYDVEESPFVAIFYEEHGQLVYSLRSREDSPIHLGKLCAKFAGGGHKHAAGFKVNVSKAPLTPRVSQQPTVGKSWFKRWFTF